jgi:hypothetical protein
MTVWDRYRTQFLDFVSTLAEAELIARAAGAALADFPRRLPEDARQGFAKAMREVGEAMIEVVDGLEETSASRHHNVSVDLGGDRAELFTPFLTILAVKVKQDRPRESLDFQAALFAQQLITIIAHTEAFLGDTLRAICHSQPEIVRASQKQISWEAALSFPDRETLFAALVDEYAASRTRTHSLKGLVTAFSKEHGLDLHLDSKDVASMTLGEQVRHLLVHNGGRVDRQFISRTGVRAAQLDETFPLDQTFVRKVKRACEKVAQAVFIAVARKYFGIEDVEPDVVILSHAEEE